VIVNRNKVSVMSYGAVRFIFPEVLIMWYFREVPEHLGSPAVSFG